MPKRILIENQNAGFGVDTVVPIVRVDPLTITLHGSHAWKKKLSLSSGNLSRKIEVSSGKTP